MSAARASMLCRAGECALAARRFECIAVERGITGQTDATRAWNEAAAWWVDSVVCLLTALLLGGER